MQYRLVSDLYKPSSNIILRKGGGCNSG